MDSINNIAHIIQLAVAPVFLLTGIAAFLGVLSNRLGRITDRARIIERRVANASGEQHSIMQKELTALWKRVKLINHAIRLCTSSALLVSTVVVTLFLGNIYRYDLSIPITLLFISAMILLIVGLLFFLQEVNRATQTMRIGMEFITDNINKD